mmetsp:Transcript_71198/g.112802  ORF Transcript_71198/g.112802 Transcript_71198/m.112802 type:complete len:257 (+) Transcript_71198:81-851(+)
MLHRTSRRARTFPAALALVFCVALTSQVCFFNTMRSALGCGRKDAIRVRAEADAKKKVVMSKAKAAPSSAPSPQATTPPAKETPAAKDPAPVEAKEPDAMEALEASRDKMSLELKEIAKGMGILTNVTRSDLKLFGLIKEKVNAKGNGPVELKDLEQKLVRAELALMLEEPSQEIANFELVVAASQKVQELAEAKEQIAELESSLAESQERNGLLLNGLKEIGGIVGVGGLGGIMTFFMKDEDIIKETKQKVTARR